MKRLAVACAFGLFALSGCSSQATPQPSPTSQLVADPDQLAADNGLQIWIRENPCGTSTTVGCYNSTAGRIELHPDLTTKSTRDSMILNAVAMHLMNLMGEEMDPCVADQQAHELGALHSVYHCPGLPVWEPSMDGW